MGLTIHYKGKLNSPELKEDFCSEMKDVAGELEWKFTEYTGPGLPVTGILIKPHPGSEPLSFLFDSKGVMYIHTALDKKILNEMDCSYVSIKTQFAGADTHIAVIKLLKYIRKKYANDLKVYDEGEYWDKGNEEALKAKFTFLNENIDLLGGILEDMPVIKNESTESLTDRIEEILKSKLNGE